MNAIAKFVGVSTPAVLNWIRDFAKNNYEKPTPGNAIIIELDEMCHYLNLKKQTLNMESLLWRDRAAYYRLGMWES